MPELLKELNTDYILQFIEKENRYLVSSGKIFFVVDRLSYSILYHLKLKYSVSEIANCVNSLFSNSNISEEGIIRILHSKELAKIIDPATIAQRHEVDNYIKFKINILNPGRINYFLKLLSVLFLNRLYYLLLPASCIITFLVTVVNASIRQGLNSFLDLMDTRDFILVTIAYLIILFLHEVGHATAAYKTKITSGSIGFGFYFIFPVFYTELTAVWGLPRSNRIKVNMGGIYFQLLINLVLIIGWYILNGSAAISALIILNTLSLLASLNPFFRYDGYWILSDFLNIPNLKKRSTITLPGILKWKREKIRRNYSARGLNNPLLIYRILNFTFWLWVYYHLVNYFITTVRELSQEMSNNEFHLSSMAKIVSLILVIALFLNSLLKNQTWTKRNT